MATPLVSSFASGHRVQGRRSGFKSGGPIYIYIHICMYNIYIYIYIYIYDLNFFVNIKHNSLLVWWKGL